MEKIDLNNYEAYFLDFMEGSLSAEERHDLFAFLELHPMLKAEMEDDFGEITLEPSAEVFDGKSDLKINENTLILTVNTVEDIMIAFVEGQLSPAHELQLQEYVKANNLESTLSYYQATILKPDTGVIFPEKQRLKEGTGVVISMSFVARFAAIAAVGLIVLTIAFQNWNGQAPTTQNEPASQFATTTSSRENTTIDFTKIRQSNPRIELDEETAEQNVTDRLPNNAGLSSQGEDNLATIEAPFAEDTTTRRPSKVKDSFIEEGEELNKPQLVEGIPPVIAPSIEPENAVVDPAYTVASVKTEEPYKIVTNAASNLIKRDVTFTRDKDIASNDYVAFSIKVGKFEFERKKSH